MLSSNNQSLDEACKKIQQIPKVRFVGVLNKMGKRIAGGFREGITSYLEDKQNQMMYVQLTLEYLMRRDFDENLGPVEYAAARRKNVVTFTFLYGDKVLFISAQPNVDIDKTAQKIMSLL